MSTKAGAVHTKSPSQSDEFLFFTTSPLTRNFLRPFLPAIFLLLIAAYVHGTSEVEGELTRLKAREALSVELHAGPLRSTVGTIKDDALFLANLREMKSIEAKPSDKDIADLAENLVEFSRSKRTYDQIRWIDQTGMELVRVDFVQGHPVVAPSDQLQYKGDRYYFIDSVRLSPGEVFVSALDLNVEHGKIVQPFSPALRVATPVVDVKGKRRGIVIINYRVQVMLDAFAATGNAAGQLMLLNRESYFLKGPQRTDEWGFMFDKPELRLSERAPAAWTRIAGADSGQAELTDGIWTWTTTRPLIDSASTDVGPKSALLPGSRATEVSQYVWKSVTHLPATNIAQVRWAVWSKLAGGVLLLVGLFAVGCWKIARATVARTLAQESVRRTNARLEETVTQRTLELRDKVTELGQEITARKQFEAALMHEKSVLDAIFKGIPDGIVYADVNRSVMNINPAFTSIFGFERDELAGKPTSYFYKSQNDYEEQGRLRFNMTAEERRQPYVVSYHRKNGQAFPGETLGTVIKAADGTVSGHIGVIRDITDRLANESRLQLAASVFTHAREGITITDASGAIIDVNEMFTQITGYSRAEVLGKNPSFLQSGQQGKDFYVALWNDLTSQGHWSGEIWNRRKNGEVYAEVLTISAVRDEAGVTQHYVGLFSDITVMKSHQSALERIAHYDTLTSLPNRLLLSDRLHQAMTQSQRRGQSLAVVYLDLDNIKAVNDTHGHDSGDTVLITVCERMKEALRDGDTLARIGGDEFVAVLADLSHPGDCIPVIERLLAAAAAPIHLTARSQVERDESSQFVSVSASIGVTFFPQDNVAADVLLRHADQAMYQAKQAGKNRYQLFDIAQDAKLQTRHANLESIRAALDNKEFLLHYQPKVNMTTGQVVGVEALIRWQHPTQGLLYPTEFLPLIEDQPISIEIGEWVIDSALTQMGVWQSQGLTMPVSVNIAARHLQQPGFATRLSDFLDDHAGVLKHHLQLEILETSALEDLGKVGATMTACHHLGVSFALDDFGTGYSSLTYLKHLPAKMLKIDQSFVRDMLHDPNDLAIVTGVIGLAKAFGRDVIAEGVETQAHGQLLQTLGCELAQGYGIARAMPASDMVDWVAGWHAGAVWTA